MGSPWAKSCSIFLTLQSLNALGKLSSVCIGALVKLFV